MSLILLLALSTLGGFWIGATIFAAIGSHRLDARLLTLSDGLARKHLEARRLSDEAYNNGNKEAHAFYGGYAKAVNDIALDHQRDQNDRL